MAKKQGPRKKRQRRSGTNKDRQVSQRLSKQVRGSFEGEDELPLDAADAWNLDAELLGRASRKRRGSKKSETEPATSARTEPGGPTHEATVVSVASGLCWVEPDDLEELERLGKLEEPLDPDEPIECVLPSQIAERQRSSITVGDRVLFARHGDTFRIEEVCTRRTVLSRPDPLNAREERVVAANMDVVVVVVAVRSPPLRPALVDRYLIAVARGGAEAVVALNKLDLVDPAEEAEALEALAPLAAGGVPVIPVSASTGRGLIALGEHLAGRTAVFVGHSGVGKSSLVNALAPAIEAATGEVSEALDKGRHTTTRSSLYDAGPFRIIDTPGIREFGLWDLEPADVRAAFADLQAFAGGCRFSNCTHVHEPACAVRAAVEAGDASAPRYAAYRRILDSLDEQRPTY